MNILSYIYNEAKVKAGELSDSSSRRLHEIIKNRIQKKFSTKVYIQDGRIPINTSYGKVVGIMMMLGDGEHALRLNYGQSSSGNVQSVDFWIFPSGDPQLHINTDDLNVVQLVNAIEEVFRTKKIGTILIDDNEEEDDDPEEYEEDEYTEAKTPKEEKIKAKEKELKRKEKEIRRQARDERRKARETRKAEKAASGETKKRIKVEKAGKEEVDISSNYNALFDDPFSDDELFELIEHKVDEMKAGKITSLLIMGDPGIGKCGDQGLDIPVKFISPWSLKIKHFFNIDKFI